VLGGAGLLVSPHDPDALAEAIRVIVEDRGVAEACVEKGLAHAAARSWERAADVVWALYADIVGRRQARHAHRG
jgi:glycosyltransferase involved in cell wall biosynthesis